MVKSATPDRQGWFGPAIGLVAALTLWRVGLLWFNRMDLFVDEAQYWLWGQELAFGYYSKPPLIGWVIRAVTDLAGSDAPFWVRLPAPILHAVTALILGWCAARLFDARAGLIVAVGYATLPLVAVGSILMSTDTVMFPALALSFVLYLRLRDGAGSGIAALCGVALGVAFLAKYAAIYYLICAAIAALFLPKSRLSAKIALTVLGAFSLTILPNILWNVVNGFSTVQHTLDNADWVRDPGTRAGLNLGGLGNFLGAQFAVFGPICFGGLLWLILRLGRTGERQRLLLCFSVPILLVVSVQALLSGAYANWAASAYLAASVVVLPWMRPLWRWLSFGINGTVALALPVAGVFAPDLTLGRDQPVLVRYLGRAALSQSIIDAAQTAGTPVVVSTNRDLLADLFYTGRDSGLQFFALAPAGRAPHHYALKYPWPGTDTAPVLFVTRRDTVGACAGAAMKIGTVSPERGAYRGNSFHLFTVPGDCWGAR